MEREGPVEKPHRTFQAAAISGVLLYFVLIGVRLGSRIAGFEAALAVGLIAVFGYVAADFVSGFVHWLGDRFGSPEMPVIGPNFVGPFRHHHVDPEEIARHDFVETNGNNSIVLIPVLAAVFHFGPYAFPGRLALAADAFAFFFGLAIFATNQFHKWAHAPVKAPIVARLQSWGLILDPGHHQLHHTSPFDTYYCITTGWLNYPLQKLRFFERLEGLAWRVLGIRAGVDDSKSAAAAA